MSPPTRIVAIGASAGGLESLEQVFDSLPANTGMAFVVIQHLSPDFRSLMDALIARHTAMRVEMAREDQVLEADRVYLLPPGKQMIVRGERLRLTDRPPSSFQLPIDTFFRSLAQDVGARAIAVVLSGTGSDGSRGVIDVHEHGGLVLVESTSAKFDGMPEAARATGIVDVTKTARELGRFLATLPELATDAPNDATELTPAESILALLHERYGIDFTLYRTTTVSRRILRRITLARVPSIEDYVQRLRTTPAELDSLYRDLLIGVTHFFRDPEAFEALEREVIPKVIDAVGPDDDIRVWVAGCATGEEAYSIAIAFLDALAARGAPNRLRVIATDVHERSLEHAAAGAYAAEQVIHVSDERARRYFTTDGTTYRVAQALRQVMMFTRHDLTRDAPFTKVQLITCRNMLIYLQPAAQRTVLSLFHFGLVPNGYLMLGASENAASLGDELIAVDARWRLFQKRRDIALISDVRTPGLSQLSASAGDDTSPALLAIYDHLLDAHMPPGFLISETRELVDSFAGAERLLRTRARRPSKHILELVDGELRMTIGGALQRVFKDGAPVQYTGVAVDFDGPARATVVARAVNVNQRGPRHVIVTFKDIVRDADRRPSTPALTELQDTRERLDVATSQLAISNEQLQAANEELQSANEELHATNEELQSVNQELFTVNAEHQRQIAELRELSDDVLQLLEGSDVGTLFLDADLRIRRFTSRVAPLFRFQPLDAGRHLADFAHALVRPQLFDDIAAVRTTGVPLATTIDGADGTHYFMRVVRTEAGIVVTLVDLSTLDRARRDPP